LRLNADRDWRNPLLDRVRVSFNGKLITNVFEADEERGLVYVFGRNYRKIRMCGRVRLIDPEEWDVHRAYTRCDRG
jgi:hypothetical protein